MDVLEYQTVGYCDRMALTLAHAAHLAYQAPPEIAAKCQEWGFSRFYYFDRENTQAFLMGNDYVAFLVFRGTEPQSLLDWLTNSKLVMARAGSGQVHAGFLASLQGIWADIKTQLPYFRTHQQYLFLTGHSLGGGLATLASFKLQKMGENIDGLYNFGSPRVGDSDFAMAFNRMLRVRTFRLVNHQDIVPRLPPRKLGYTHVGQLVYFNQQGRRQRGLGEHLIDQEDSSLTELVIDHDMAAYIRCLSQQRGMAKAVRVQL
jgi:triacylglycerol lipase